MTDDLQERAREEATSASVDVRAEYDAFKIWAGNTFPDQSPPSSASHLFSAWMASARHRLAFASPTPEPSGAVVEALRACRIELDHCQRQLAAHGQTGSPGNSVSRALEAARTALASLDAGSASS